MLRDILPARARRIAYVAYAVLGLALGAIPVYCSATAAATPTWTLGALAVYAFIGSPLFGATAASNIPSTSDIADYAGMGRDDLARLERLYDQRASGNEEG